MDDGDNHNNCGLGVEDDGELRYVNDDASNYTDADVVDGGRRGRRSGTESTGKLASDLLLFGEKIRGARARGTWRNSREENNLYIFIKKNDKTR